MGRYEEFAKFRRAMNARILGEGTLETKRLIGIDDRVYHPGAIDAKTGELMGLMSSLVLRCDDCVTHHIIQAPDRGALLQEFQETLAIGLVVGGSIVIPHLRRAVAFLDEMTAKRQP